MKLKNPIVLVHGLGATSRLVFRDYFLGLRAHFTALGNEVLVAHLSPWQTIEHRAAQLKTQLEQRLTGRPDTRFNIIGHSLGGLDSRYLISKLGFAERVSSLTTIGSTHRGSALARLITDRGGRVIASLDRAFRLLGWSAAVLEQVTPEYCQGELARLAPNDPRVAYFSAITSITRPAIAHSLPPFWVTHPILDHFEGENDGIVSTWSASWGHEICRVAGDHYAQIGHRFGWRSRGGLAGGDHFKLYERVVRHLAAEGF